MKAIKLIFVFALIASANLFAQVKVGYVDSETILKALPEAIKAQGELDALINKWNNQLDSMTLALQTAYGEYQEKEKKMKEDEKLTAQQNLVKMQNDLERFRREKFSQGTGEIYVKQEELLKPVKEKIFVAIENVAKDEGMQFIFDKSGDIILLYADPQFDMTFKVLDRLKRGKN